MDFNRIWLVFVGMAGFAGIYETQVRFGANGLAEHEGQEARGTQGS